MNRSPISSISVGLLALLLGGASCGHGRENAQNNDQPAASAGPRVESISSVDISELSTSERRVWTDLVNDLLSPCGEPVSVGRCATTAGACNRCVPAARYLTRMVAEGYARNEIEENFSARYGRDGAKTINVDEAPVRGAPMAQITIVEFSDFQCPYCGAAAPLVERALREFEGRVKVIFKQYPLDGHPRAMPAARAAVAAGRQHKFWEMHDLLFSHQHDLEDEDLERYAVQLELDLDRFRADLASPDVQRRIDADRQEGHRVGVQGTPTIFINGRLFHENPQSLIAYLRVELDQ